MSVGPPRRRRAFGARGKGLEEAAEAQKLSLAREYEEQAANLFGQLYLLHGNERARRIWAAVPDQLKVAGNQATRQRGRRRGEADRFLDDVMLLRWDACLRQGGTPQDWARAFTRDYSRTPASGGLTGYQTSTSIAGLIAHLRELRDERCRRVLIELYVDRSRRRKKQTAESVIEQVVSLVTSQDCPMQPWFHRFSAERMRDCLRHHHQSASSKPT